MGIFFALRGGRALFPMKQLCSLAYFSLTVTQPRPDCFRTGVRDRQNTNVHLPCFKETFLCVCHTTTTMHSALQRMRNFR